ncbi:MAG: DUF47 family protein [Coriobacteriia bacterium]|nr:DUF47 family protein [Coriobacteriia bacterium]
MPKKKKESFDYFDQFKELSGVCVEASELLVSALEGWENAEALLPAMEKMHAIENKGDEINHAVYHQAAKDFVTPIEREDLLAMAHNLDDVVDYIEDVLVSFYIYDAKFLAPGTQEFAQLINKSCIMLNKAMDDFRNFKKSKKFRERIMEVNDCEEEGDRLYLKVIRDLHTTDTENPMRVLVWSRIFEKMEKCCDACEHVADTMSTVILRNS